MIYVDTQVQTGQQVKVATKITLVIGMITAGFVGLSLFANAFLAGPIAKDIKPADTDPPFIHLQTPIGTNVSGMKWLSMNIIDHSDITLATFSIDGKTRYTEYSPDKQWFLLLDTTRMSGGRHTVSFSATDTEGNTSATEIISFNVAN